MFGLLVSVIWLLRKHVVKIYEVGPGCVQTTWTKNASFETSVITYLEVF